MDTSNSDIETFLRCRRMWSFTSHNRMSLRSQSPSPHMAFHVGSVVHKALEAQISISRRPHIGSLITEAEQELEDYYRNIVGVGWSTAEKDQLEGSRKLIIGIVNHYFDYWGAENPLGEEFKYLLAETTFQVKIPGTEHFLRGTIDGIARHKDGGIFLVEHKTTSMGFPEARELQISRQLQAYVWAAAVLLDNPVEGIIYDGIAKKVPIVPSLTKSGTLSKAITTTTPEIYREAIRVCGLDEADYAEVLFKLQGPSQFFQRKVIRFPQRSLELFGEQLKQIVSDMANQDLPLYPNRVWAGCWDCRYTELCTAMQMGEDTEYLLQTKYKRGESRAPSQKIPPVTSLSLEGL